MYGNVRLDDSIVADNQRPSDGANDIWGTVQATSKYNLIGVDSGLSGISNGVDGNQIGTVAMPVDPMLVPLQDNGGPTFTHAILPGSPAVDSGDLDFAGPPDFDQRGAPYQRVHGAAIDIGAYELLLADGNLDGHVDSLDYLLWAGFFGDDPVQDPPGSPGNGDYNNDGKVDGLDYLLWAGQFRAGGSAVAAFSTASQPASLATEEMSAVDTIPH